MVAAFDRLPFNNIFLLGNRITLFRLGDVFRWSHILSSAGMDSDNKGLVLAALPCFVAALCVSWLAKHRVCDLRCLCAVRGGGARIGNDAGDTYNRNDISYGLYLYAWPIEKTLIWLGFWTNLLLLGLTTFILSAVAGAISWFLVEKPVMSAVRLSSRKGLRAPSCEAG